MIRSDKEIAASIGVRLREPLGENDVVALSIDDTGGLWTITNAGHRGQLMAPAGEGETVPATGEHATAALALLAPRFFHIGDPVPPGALYLRRRMPDGTIEFEPAGARH